jgi:chromosome segregation and condensation protein ScpB
MPNFKNILKKSLFPCICVLSCVLLYALLLANKELNSERQLGSLSQRKIADLESDLAELKTRNSENHLKYQEDMENFKHIQDAKISAFANQAMKCEAIKTKLGI